MDCWKNNHNFYQIYDLNVKVHFTKLWWFYLLPKVVFLHLVLAHLVNPKVWHLAPSFTVPFCYILGETLGNSSAQLSQWKSMFVFPEQRCERINSPHQSFLFHSSTSDTNVSHFPFLPSHLPSDFTLSTLDPKFLICSRLSSLKRFVRVISWMNVVQVVIELADLV